MLLSGENSSRAPYEPYQLGEGNEGTTVFFRKILKSISSQDDVLKKNTTVNNSAIAILPK